MTFTRCIEKNNFAFSSSVLAFSAVDLSDAKKKMAESKKMIWHDAHVDCMVSGLLSSACYECK